MTFQNIWPLAFLILIPGIILFYILKQRAVDKKVSSTMLWREVYRNIEATTPFEKLKNNLLMYLQIAAMILLIVSLMAPVVRNAGKAAKNVVLVVDTSASMSFSNGDDTRLEAASYKACKFVDTLSETDVVTLISCDEAAEILYQGKDKSTLKNRIKSLTQSDSAGTLDNAIDTVTALTADMTNVQIMCYTDTEFSAEDMTGGNENASCKVVSLYSDGENCGVNFVNYSSEKLDESRYQVETLAQVTNYGQGEQTLDVTLYLDTTPVDMKSVTIKAGESQVVYFEDFEVENGDTHTITAKISGNDSLSGDNSKSVNLRESGDKSILLVSSGNLFLEKALSLYDNATLYKADSTEVLSAGVEEYDLYVFDGTVPLGDLALSDCKLSENGALLFWNLDSGFSDDDGFITKNGDIQNVYLTFEESEASSYLEDYSFGVSQGYTYLLPEEATSCIKDGDGQSVGYFGTLKGRNAAVIGFDIHNTDLALKAEFPVFMTQITSVLLGDSVTGEAISNFPEGESQVVPAEEVTINGSAKDGATSDRGIRNILLGVLVCLLVAEWIVYMRQSNSRRKLQYLAVRCLLLICIVLAMAGIYVTKRGKNSQTIFLVDVSDSVSQSQKEIEEYLERVTQEKPEDQSYAIVAFGKNTAVRQFMTQVSGTIDDSAAPVSSATNIEKAITSATAMFDDGAAKRIVLVTDGQENEGSMNKVAASLRNNDIELELLRLTDSISDSNEVYIEDLQVPSVIHTGDKYNITVTVKSNVETDAVLKLYEGRTLRDTKEIHVTTGESQYVFVVTAQESQVATYKAVIEPELDTVTVNNTYVTYAESSARDKILVVEGESGKSEEFAKVLDKANVDYDVVRAASAPKNISELTNYKAVITLDCYYDDLPQGFVNSLEIFVKDYAGGYICIGGENSYALGGYSGTVLEDILPVNMNLQGEKEIPKMAMVMVVDHSGSMTTEANDGSKLTSLTLAKQAAIAAASELRETDEVGVLEFDDTYHWTYELSEAGDTTQVTSAIKGIDLGGGTSIYPALAAATEAISKSDASIKHIILITDGEDEYRDFDDIIDQMKEQGITLSTVAVGADSDTEMMESLAASCDGRYYYTDVNNSIPRIFAQEVYLSTEEYLQNRELYPVLNGSSAITQGVFDDGVPALYGYIATTAKSTADVILSSDQQDPILATWQYGLGRTVAWCSDGDFNWTAGLATWDKYPQLWSNIINYAITSTDSGLDKVEIKKSTEGNTITYTTDDYDSSVKVYGVVTDDEGNQSEIELNATKPGTYQGTTDITDVGVYSVNVRKEKDGQVTGSINTAFTNQYSAEYKFSSGSSAIESFAQMAGGEIITAQDDIWNMDMNKVDVRISLTNLFLILAVVLLMVDIAARRLAIDFADIARGFAGGVTRAVAKVFTRRKVSDVTRGVYNSKTESSVHRNVERDEGKSDTQQDSDNSRGVGDGNSPTNSGQMQESGGPAAKSSGVGGSNTQASGYRTQESGGPAAKSSGVGGSNTQASGYRTQESGGPAAKSSGVGGSNTQASGYRTQESGRPAAKSSGVGDGNSPAGEPVTPKDRKPARNKKKDKNASQQNDLLDMEALLKKKKERE
jgi:Mg-chelatase subunit ChlD